MAVTDQHKACRDAVVTVLTAALFTDYATLSAAVVGLDDLDDDLRTKSMPFVGVACVGPDQDRPEWTSNAQDGLGYPIMVGMFAAGVIGGAKSPGIPDMTLFRRIVRVTFQNKRLSGVSQIGWCEVTDSGPIFDKGDPAFEKLSTALIVTCVGKFARS